MSQDEKKQGALGRLPPRLEPIFHPVRLRILLEAAGREVTAGQIAHALPDVPSASLYRHLRRMVADGALAVVGERPVRGTVEKTYAVTTVARILSPESEPPDPETFFAYFLRFLSLLQQQFRLYMNQGTFEPAQDGVSFRVYAPYLTPDEQRQVKEEINAVLMKAMKNEPRPDRQPYLMGSVVIPNKIPFDADLQAKATPEETL